MLPNGPMERNALLDGWRGVSVLSVVALHLFFYHWPQEFLSLRAIAASGDWLEFARQVALRPLQELGTIGVPIFFLISGFIITKLLIREEEATGSVSIAAFYIRRIFRIMPALFVYLTAIALVQASGVIHISPGSHLASATFTCNLYQCSWFHAHLWSLAVEEQFYLLWPVMFVLLGRARLKGLVAITLAFALLSVSFEPAQPFLYISMGALVATLGDYSRSSVMPPRIALVCLTTLFVVSFVPGTMWLVPMLKFVKPFLVAGLFFGSFCSPVFKRALVWPPLVTVGKVSYGLYLWQQFFTAPHSEYIVQPNGFALVMLPVIVFAIYNFVEVPLIRIGRNLSENIQARRLAILGSDRPII